MLSVLQAVQLLRRKQKLRAPLRKLLAIAHASRGGEGEGPSWPLSLEYEYIYKWMQKASV